MMDRITRFRAAVDYGEKGGKHGVELAFVLRGNAGAVQFVVFTNWMLPAPGARPGSILGATIGDPSIPASLLRPMPADLGYHSRKPLFEGQAAATPDQPCEWLGSSVCYYDGSSLQADPVFDVLLREGDDGVWRELAKYYAETFGEEA